MNTPKILIVDDVSSNVLMLEGILRSEGFETLIAGDGASARQISHQNQPDLILLDVLMPGETGFETCAQLKSDPATSNIPIIFLSALDDVDSKVRGLQIGGVDYLTKPVYGAEVLARVRVHLRIGEANRAFVREQQVRLDALRSAQQGILVRPADLPEACFAVFYRPMQEAGGDFYDVVRLDPDAFCYFVADVSGHGMSAAFLTSAVKALLRQYAGPLYSPEDTMRGIGSVMRQILSDEQYLTACYTRFNHRTRMLSVVSAGHPPVLVVHASGEAELIRMDSDPLGMFSSVVLHRKDLYITPGDRIFLYTDGLIETGPGGRRAGLDFLIATCKDHRSLPLASAVEAIASTISHSCKAFSDDLLLLALEATR